MTNNKQQRQDNDLIVVLPGDNVTQHILTNNNNNNSSHSKRPKLGVGLRYDESTQQVYATLAGRLMKMQQQQQQQPVFFVRHNYKHRYRPAVDDRVVGIVEERCGSDAVHGGDLYRIQIGASHPALLNNLSGFEGATKRNRPALKPGQVLYLRVVSTMTTAAAAAASAADTIVSCQLGPHDVGVTRKDWMTNEGAYGELRGGTVVRVSTGLARELLHPDNVVLYELQKQQQQQPKNKIAFEVAIGVNGMIWIHSALPQYTILIQNAILNSEVLSEEQVRSMVKSLVYTVEKQLQQDRDAMMEE